MPYRFARERQDYTDYASGRVFYSLPGHPAFPVRLASETLQRCLAARQRLGAAGPVVLYDPCCGAAYHLSTLAYLHWPAIGSIIASDVDAAVLEVARRNLSLLTLEGLDRRIAEITRLLAQYGKPSHAEALESAQRLRQRLARLLEHHPIDVHLLVADATDRQAVREGLAGRTVDVVLSDVPYGWHSSWQITGPGHESASGPLQAMLDALLPVLAPHAVVAIAANKRQRIAHPEYRRLERFQIGKRQVALLHPLRPLPPPSRSAPGLNR